MPDSIDAVVTHHTDGFRSGVARFNELLALHLGVPLVSLHEPGAFASGCPLLSFKVSELSPEEVEMVASRLDGSSWNGQVFLHELSDLPLERRLVASARRVLCGNREILERLGPACDSLVPVWTPGLVLDDRPYRPAEVTIFSFGMAHKIRTDMFGKLRELLERSGKSYAIYVSAANHETASLRDAELVFNEMHEIFPEELFFLGNLSDVAVANELRRATFFAAFFTPAVRDNNTSIASALERGCAVLTNLDRLSPPEYVHLENVIDLDRCDELPTDPLTLARLRLGALETARRRGWDQLLAAVSPDA